MVTLSVEKLHEKHYAGDKTRRGFFETSTKNALEGSRLRNAPLFICVSRKLISVFTSVFIQKIDMQGLFMDKYG